jgi:hypothetical protein
MNYGLGKATPDRVTIGRTRRLLDEETALSPYKREHGPSVGPKVQGNATGIDAGHFRR